jgi:hypothetical protein
MFCKIYVILSPQKMCMHHSAMLLPYRWPEHVEKVAAQFLQQTVIRIYIGGCEMLVAHENIEQTVIRIYI